MCRFYLIIISIAITLIACASNQPSQITIKSFKGFSEVSAGKSTDINWEFENCNRVRIENLKRNYNAIDSIHYTPESSTILNFIAMNETDTLRLKWRVDYKDLNENIKTGPERKHSEINQPSYIESEFFTSLIPAGISPGINKLKVVKIDRNENNDSLILRLLVLDDFGNLITGLSEQRKGDLELNASLKCSNEEVKFHYNKITEVAYDSLKFIDMAICLDNSAIAGDYYPIFDEIKSFSKNINPDDRIHFRTFNQNLLTNVLLQDASQFSKFIKDLRIEKANGLSSIYKNMYSAISYLNSSGGSREQLMILIAYSSDNSSLVYDRNDVVELASRYSIPIYVIGIGTAVDSYSFKYLTEMTGGKYYQVEDKDISNLVQILSEINFSQKAYYKASIPFPSKIQKMDNFSNVAISLALKGKIVTDSTRIRQVKERQFFRYQSVAAFDFKDTLSGTQFKETITSLSLILKNNQDKVIELIGNSGIEGTPEETYSLGLKRAQSIRRLLIDNGVSANQIRIRSDGSNNPIYFLQESTWMQYYNRRVELRWLDPDLMPFELIGQSFDSEAEALVNVELWEDKGYRAYYERYLQNYIPIYRVKIWGFRTQDEAESTKNNIERKFAVKLNIQ